MARRRLRKLRTPADRGSMPSPAKTNAATCQQASSTSQGAQDMRQEVAFENLPEDILHHIHSLLSVHDAARAACVSRVFLRSWRCYSNLVLDHCTLGLSVKQFSEAETYLIDRIDRILENHYSSGVDVKTLELNFYPCRNINASYLDRWLKIATKSGIAKLSLEMPTVMEKYNFPCSVLSDKEAASSIQSLNLFSCAFHPTSALGCLTRLKTLDLSSVNVTEEGLGHMLSKSSALQQLMIVAISGITCLKIPSVLLQLKILSVKRCKMIQVVEIDAPNLYSFRYSGAPLVQISIINSSQLKDVDLSYCYTSTTRTSSILSYARASLPSLTPNVQKLILLSRNQDIDTHTPMLRSKLLHLKKLEIIFLSSEVTFSPSYDFFSLVSFLDASPILESFVLRVGRDGGWWDPVVDNEYQRRKLECQHKSLRHVTITSFYSSKSMVELTVHILESAPSLECLTLDTTRGHYRDSHCIHKCPGSDEIGKCWAMSETALAEAHRAVKTAEKHITRRVPSTVKFKIIGPCSRCHTGNP